MRIGNERVRVDEQERPSNDRWTHSRLSSGVSPADFGHGRRSDDVLVDYAQLEREDVLAVLEYAAAYTREREVPVPSAG